jgi:hypothetical protein
MLDLLDAAGAATCFVWCGCRRASMLVRTSRGADTDRVARTRISVRRHRGLRGLRRAKHARGDAGVPSADACAWLFVTKESLWALDVLVQEATACDASIFQSGTIVTYRIRSRNTRRDGAAGGQLVERGSTVRLGRSNSGRRWRLLSTAPVSAWTRWGMSRLNAISEKRDLLYASLEIDPDQPRLPLSHSCGAAPTSPLRNGNLSICLGGSPLSDVLAAGSASARLEPAHSPSQFRGAQLQSRWSCGAAARQHGVCSWLGPLSDGTRALNRTRGATCFWRTTSGLEAYSRTEARASHMWSSTVCGGRTHRYRTACGQRRSGPQRASRIHRSPEARSPKCGRRLAQSLCGALCAAGSSLSF